jgi:hypothetical protein
MASKILASLLFLFTLSGCFDRATPSYRLNSSVRQSVGAYSLSVGGVNKTVNGVSTEVVKCEGTMRGLKLLKPGIYVSESQAPSAMLAVCAENYYATLVFIVDDQVKLSIDACDAVGTARVELEPW